ncbi:amidohydrolase family protein [Candidimonas nitroreducens]|uniref:2-pyrone-4,6-dicarboxylate hydrolase n=1 Tax=Candidimonas nitroreducens TaxID=683354 RepID=A0A225MQ55_9BURK|nr:amidohydrolase family protein [Candidimonas nitroreducens]OWT63467.1 2-pyrone-4,6-dicarboxylate hydrolase [Candidimonas nitroreducens]
MHIFDARFPLSAKAVLASPKSATVEQYRAVQAGLGSDHCVIVQPSGYGVDNRCLVDALNQFHGAARGVAVIDETVSEAELSDLQRAGVRGIRFNLVQTGATSISMLEPLAARIAPLGWHVQVHCTPATLRQISGMLSALPVPVVLDHMGSVGADGAALIARHRDALLDLMKQAHLWMKLSGPYLNSWSPEADVPELGKFVRDLAQLAPDRIVWGSDWPHVTEATPPDDQLMVQTLRQWVGNDSIWARVLWENPQRLYGFSLPQTTIPSSN